ncbi:MAG TPA: FtsQ-type POTRA domain-containing protein [Gaiellaceae bacterium]|nr:FtsQ-type POTRA domain-containing protein [Gaiellaceae bacterium]
MSATRDARQGRSRPAARSRPRRPSEPRAARLPLPSLRSAAIAVGILLVAGLAYLGALETSVFAVGTIDVSGGSPQVKAEVRHALSPVLGTSLLRVDDRALARRVEALPDVVSVRFDRSFPHTLHVTVKPERAVLLARQGKAAWVVSARGRVMRAVANPKHSKLPRLWLAKDVHVSVGQTLDAADGKLAAAAVAPVTGATFAGGVRTVDSGPQALTLVLKSGPQVRLGGIGNLHLKLTIARRILRIAAGESTTAPAYVDVSVPERPVLGSQQP